MEQRKRVEFEYANPQSLGGFSKEQINDKDTLYKVCGYLIKETDTDVIITMGESEAYYLHQLRVPKCCICGEIKVLFTLPTKDEIQ